MKNFARFIVFLLVAGLAFGGWQLYTRSGGKAPSVSLPQVTFKNDNSNTGNGNNNGNGNTGDNNGNNNGNTTNGGGSGASLTLITSATKKGWLETQVERFNAEKNRNVRIEYVETRDALQGILNGKQKPVLWSPSAPLWATRLSEAWGEKHGGETLVADNDPNSYRVYLRTPIVFVTTKRKATFLRPLLSGARAWDNLADLSAGKKKLPGATRLFVWAHADPIKSNSGFLTLGLLLDAYVQSTNGATTPEQAAVSAGFANYLHRVEKTMPLNAPVREGSSALMKAFLQNPDRYDVITAYESSALEAAAKNDDVAVLYPNPTVASEQVVVVLNADWVTPDQKDTAAELLTFLGGEDSLRDGVNQHFRPTRQSGSVTLSPEIGRRRAQGFQQTFTSVETPSYEALNEAAVKWNAVIGTK